MNINGIGNTYADYTLPSRGITPKDERNGLLQESVKKLLREKFDMTEQELQKELKNHSAVVQKQEGAPYRHLADENNIIVYNGVTFVCDDLRRELCLGDMTNSDDVIRIPMSKGGCLMVNRDNIDDLRKAISMFSPEDVNLILRALRKDAMVQKMKKEIEEMEDGIGKSSQEEYADSVENAEKAAAEKGKANGYSGYEGDMSQEEIFELKEWQINLLFDDKEERIV